MDVNAWLGLTALLAVAWAVFAEVRIWALEKRLHLLHQWCEHAGEAIAELEDAPTASARAASTTASPTEQLTRNPN